MTTITTHQAKTHLSRYLADVENGQEFIIARGKSAVANEEAQGQTTSEGGRDQRPGLRVSSIGICAVHGRCA